MWKVYTPKEDTLCFVCIFSLSVLSRLEIICNNLKQTQDKLFSLTMSQVYLDVGWASLSARAIPHAN